MTACTMTRLPTFGLVTIAFLVVGGVAEAAARPNILIVIADDATFHELPLFGRKNIVTPNVDRLASEGMTFRRAYVSMSMCVPCRAELYTGLYPMHSGVCWNHMPTQPGIRSIVQYLSGMGYRVGLAGKIHATPLAVYPFEMVDGFERNCVALTADYDCKGIKEFMARDASQPFCLVVASVLPHSPWTVGDWQHFKPAKFVLPPYLVDTPETRRSLARYYAEYEALDKQLGDVLETLKETGQVDKTLTLFTSEQGGQWPGCKWTNWEEGLHTALVVRWPGHVEPGSRTDALVQYAERPAHAHRSGRRRSARGQVRRLQFSFRAPRPRKDASQARLCDAQQCARRPTLSDPLGPRRAISLPS